MSAVVLNKASGGTLTLQAENSATDDVVTIPNAGFLGEGQTWQATANVVGTTYQNLTGKPIVVKLSATYNASETLSLYVEDIAAPTFVVDLHTSGAGAANLILSLQAIVPNGHYYKAVATLGTPTLNSWKELR